MFLFQGCYDCFSPIQIKLHFSLASNSNKTPIRILDVFSPTEIIEEVTIFSVFIATVNTDLRNHVTLQLTLHFQIQNCIKVRYFFDFVRFRLKRSAEILKFVNQI